MVKTPNRLGYCRSIEYFAARGFVIDWVRSNINRLSIYIVTPDYLSEDESITLLSTSTECLYNLTKAEEVKEREARVLNNIDNTTGSPIEEKKLKRLMDNLFANKAKDRQEIADWFNHYNLEVARPDHPLIVISTKPKKTLMVEGRRLVRSLFEEGKLRKLTEEEYDLKLEKYTKEENT